MGENTLILVSVREYLNTWILEYLKKCKCERILGKDCASFYCFDNLQFFSFAPFYIESHSVGKRNILLSFSFSWNATSAFSSLFTECMLCRFEISQSFNHHPLLPVNPINLEKGIDQSIILQPTIVTSQSNQSCITSSRSIIWSPPTGNSRPNQSADTHCSCQLCIGLPILHRVANLHWFNLHWFQLTLVPTANYLFQYQMNASVGLKA